MTLRYVMTNRGEVLCLLAEHSHPEETRDPTPDDDLSIGIDPGSLWFNIAPGAHRAWMCIEAHEGNASWAYMGANYAAGGADPVSAPGGGMTQAEADALYVSLSGDMMGGPLNIDSATLGSSDLILSQNGLKRWVIRKDDSAETGGNNGSDLRFDSYDDAGNFIQTEFLIPRGAAYVVTTGTHQFNGGIRIPDSRTAIFSSSGTGALSNRIFQAADSALALMCEFYAVQDGLGHGTFEIRNNGPAGGLVVSSSITGDLLAAHDVYARGVKLADVTYVDAQDALGVLKAGDSMTGALTLVADPTLPLEASTKQYVDESVAAMALYKGVWQVAANVPDLTPATINPLNGWSWVAETADPTVPETAPAALPGIGGKTVDSGDRILWDAGNAAYDLVKGSSLSIQEARTLFVDTTGDTMTGPLVLAADPATALEASTKQYTDAKDAANAAAIALKVNKAGDTMTGPLVLPDDPLPPQAANRKYVDQMLTAVMAMAVMKAGSTMTGLLVLSGDPTNVRGAATKQYVDTAVASQSLYQGNWRVATNVPDLTPAVANPLNAWSWVAVTADPQVAETAPAAIPGIGGQTIYNGDKITWNTALAVYERVQGSSLTAAQADAAYVNVAGDVMAGYLLLNADPVDPLGAVTKQSLDAVAAGLVPVAGGVMTGNLALPLAPGPTNPEDVTTKDYVDRSLAASSLYQGAWQVAANTPDLTAAAPLNGYSWIAQTVDPDIPEAAPAGLPGITAGTLIGAGTTVRWNGNTPAWELIQGGGLTQAVAGTLYIAKTGDTMTGNLTIQNDGQGVLFNGGGRFYKAAGTGMVIREHAAGTQLQIEDNNGANRRDILDTINGDARYNPLINAKVAKAGDSMTGALGISNIANGAVGLVLQSNTNANGNNLPALEFRSSDGRAGSKLYSVQMTTATQYGGHENNFTVYQFCGGYSYRRLMWGSVASPPNLNLDGDCYARGVKLTSDPSLKERIRPVDADEVSRAFAALKPVRYHWKASTAYNPLSPDGRVTLPDFAPDRDEWGFLADDLEAIPDMVSIQDRTETVDSDGEPIANPITEKVKHYDLAAVVAIAVAKIAALEAEIVALKATRA